MNRSQRTLTTSKGSARKMRLRAVTVTGTGTLPGSFAASDGNGNQRLRMSLPGPAATARNLYVTHPFDLLVQSALAKHSQKRGSNSVQDGEHLK